jgi:hypothetical protein
MAGGGEHVMRGHNAEAFGLWLLVGLSALAQSGCHRGGIRLAHAEGQVLLDGKPVPYAGVVFSPTAGGPIATGSTDENGHFVLSTINRKGAPIGDHRVTVGKAETKEIPPPPGQWLPDYHTTYIIPERYTDPDRSGLLITVSKNRKKNVFSLELSSK